MLYSFQHTLYYLSLIRWRGGGGLRQDGGGVLVLGHHGAAPLPQLPGALLAAGAARPGAQASRHQEVAETQVPPPLPDPQEQAAGAHPVTTVDQI